MDLHNTFGHKRRSWVKECLNFCEIFITPDKEPFLVKKKGKTEERLILNKTKITGIYKITSPTNKIYIGRSEDIFRRWCSYISINCESQPLLYDSLQTHGWKAHIFEILHQCEKWKLSEWEEYYQEKYNSHHLKGGLNLTFSFHKSKEVKKISRKIKQEREFKHFITYKETGEKLKVKCMLERNPALGKRYKIKVSEERKKKKELYAKIHKEFLDFWYNT